MERQSNRPKPQYKLSNVQIVPAKSLWPTRHDLEGKFVAMGQMVNDEGEIREPNTRTSLLVNINISEGYIETLNSIYKIV